VAARGFPSSSTRRRIASGSTMRLEGIPGGYYLISYGRGRTPIACWGERSSDRAPDAAGIFP
jgi:hypothetical protein